MKKQTGFTLIELAIVLVIIGLLLGGVLKGQELINQAKIKNVIADFNGITAAYYGYQDRYKAIPGDDSGAARFATTTSGNGNGQIAGDYNDIVAAPTAADESSLFWQHLRLAGFVGGSGGTNPNNALAGIIGIQQGGDLMRSTSGTAGTGFTGLILCSSNLPDKIAVAVDTTIDDGDPQTGSVRGHVQTTPNPAVPQDAETGVYSETGGRQYLLCKAL